MKLNAPEDVANPIDKSDGESMPEGRRQIRYPLRAPVQFMWAAGDEIQRKGKGNTRNIGEGGAYILTRNCPLVGAQISLIFRFPYLPGFARFHQLEMKGEVVRTDVVPTSKSLRGFAVASRLTILQEIDELDLEDASKDAD